MPRASEPTSRYAQHLGLASQPKSSDTSHLIIQPVSSSDYSSSYPSYGDGQARDHSDGSGLRLPLHTHTHTHTHQPVDGNGTVLKVCPRRISCVLRPGCVSVECDGGAADVISFVT